MSFREVGISPSRWYRWFFCLATRPSAEKHHPSFDDYERCSFMLPSFPPDQTMKPTAPWQYDFSVLPRHPAVTDLRLVRPKRLRIYEELHLRDNQGLRNHHSRHARGLRVHRRGLFTPCVPVRCRASDPGKSLPFHAEHGQHVARFVVARASSSPEPLFDQCTRQGLTITNML